MRPVPRMSLIPIVVGMLAPAAWSVPGGDTQPGGLFCLADCNRDLVVDSADIGAFLADWGGTQFDFNGNGSTDGGDLGTLIVQWGQICHSFHDNVEIQLDGDRLVVTGSCIPDHEYGNFPGECGNPNSVADQNDTWRLPLVPEPTGSPAVDALAQLGPIGIMVNGVAFYNPYDGGGIEAPGTICMDDCNAHPSPDSRYHYHQYSPCIDCPNRPGARTFFCHSQMSAMRRMSPKRLWSASNGLLMNVSDRYLSK